MYDAQYFTQLQNNFTHHTFGHKGGQVHPFTCSV